MHARTFGVIEFQKIYHFVNVFGHRAQGLPGLFFTGEGHFLKVLKEKILYFAKDKDLTIPLRKYAVTIELPPFLQAKAAKGESLLHLELPILLIFLQLSENIRIKNLERCFCAGRVRIDGTISPWRPPSHFLQRVSIKSGYRACYLGLDEINASSNIPQISLKRMNPELFY